MLGYGPNGRENAVIFMTGASVVCTPEC